MNVSEARALVSTYLYPLEFKMHARELKSLAAAELIEPQLGGRAKCTPRGEHIALRQLLYILSTRDLIIKTRTNKRLETFFDETLQELRCE